MSHERQSILSHPADGRVYRLGSAENIEVKFRADGDEVANNYAITEWWMEPNAPGLDAHIHETNDELIYVIEGTASVLIGDEWIPMEKGGMVVIPAGVTHAFRNASDARMGILNIFLSGAYEAMMPQIQAMFAHRQ